MIPEQDEGSEPDWCPECGEELVREKFSFRGKSITVVACTGHPDCDYFYWTFPGGDGNPEPVLGFKNTADWAIGKSLQVILKNRPRNRYAPLRELFPDRGGGARV